MMDHLSPNIHQSNLDQQPILQQSSGINTIARNLKLEPALQRYLQGNMDHNLSDNDKPAPSKEIPDIQVQLIEEKEKTSQLKKQLERNEVKAGEVAELRRRLEEVERDRDVAVQSSLRRKTDATRLERELQQLRIEVNHLRASQGDGYDRDLSSSMSSRQALSTEQLVKRLQRDLATALDARQLSRNNYEELSRAHQQALTELDFARSENLTARRQLLELQRAHDIGQNDLSIAVRQAAKLSKQYDKAQTDIVTLKDDVCKLGQQLLESMNAQDELMAQSMVLLKQRDEAYSQRDEAMSQRDNALRKATTGSPGQVEVALSVRDDALSRCTAAQEECKELRSRLAAQDRLLQEQCRKMLSSEGSGYSSSDGGLSDGANHGSHRSSELQKEYARIRKDYQDLVDECSLLREQCQVARRERGDALAEQEAAISRCYRIQQEKVALEEDTEKLKGELYELREMHNDLKQTHGLANKEKVDAMQSRDWAFEERSRILTERDSARRECNELRCSRDKAISEHVSTLRELDNLREQLDTAQCKLSDQRAHRDMLTAQLTEKAHMWQLDYITKDAQLRKGIDGQLGFTIGGGEDNPDPRLGTAVVVVDVTANGPASNVLKVKDIIVSVNGKDLSCVPQSAAARTLKESSSPLRLLIRREMPRLEPRPYEAVLQGSKDFGLTLESQICVVAISPDSAASSSNQLQIGDRILKVNGSPVTNVDIGKVMKNVGSAKKAGALKLTVFRQARRQASYNPIGIRRPSSVASTTSGHVQSHTTARTAASSAPTSRMPSLSDVNNVNNSTHEGQSVDGMVFGGGTMRSRTSTDYLSGTTRSHGSSEGGYQGTVRSRGSAEGVLTSSPSKPRSSADREAPNVESTPHINAPEKANAAGQTSSSQAGVLCSLHSASSTSTGTSSTEMTSRDKDLHRKSKPLTDGHQDSSDGTSSTDLLNPLLATVLQGEERLRALQSSRRKAHTRHMSVDLTSSNVMDRLGVANSRRGSVDVSHLYRESDKGDTSMSSSESSLSQPGRQMAIEAGVGDDRDLPLIKTPSADGRQLRFVLLTRNEQTGTLGFCIQGGNCTGIYISQITDSKASSGESPSGGLCIGDRILEVNGTDLSHATREMAASCLRQSSTSVLICVENNMAAYQNIKCPYDSVFVRANFGFFGKSSWQISFPTNSVFHIIDTMPKRTGHWEAKMLDSSGQVIRSGMIPNRTSVLSHRFETVTGYQDGKPPFDEIDPPQAPSQRTSTVF